MRQAVIVATADGRGRVLLVLQRGGAFAGHWLLPGGRVEEGEEAAVALARELREETGLGLRRPREVARYLVRVRGDAVPEWVVRLYRADMRGHARAEEGSDVAWRDPRAQGLHPSLRRELVDAGLRREPGAAIGRELAAAGILMERLA